MKRRVPRALVARLVAHRRGDVNDVVNQGPAGSNTGTPGVPGIQAPINGTPGQSPSALSAHRWRIVDEFVPALDALTAKLITGDGKYDAYIAAGSPDGSPSASTSHVVPTSVEFEFVPSRISSSVLEGPVDKGVPGYRPRVSRKTSTASSGRHSGRPTAVPRRRSAPPATGRRR